MKVITIVHDGDGGFETVEMDVVDPDAVLVVNFPEGKVDLHVPRGIDVRSRDEPNQYGFSLSPLSASLIQSLSVGPNGVLSVLS